MRITYDFLLFLHVSFVVFWVGGMFVLQFALRPVAADLLEPPQRLPLMVGVLARFFFWVSIAVFVILVSGVAMILVGGGFAETHGSVHLMFALGLVMMALFAHVRFAPFKRARAAVGAKDWPVAASNLNQMRKLVSVNLALGILTIAVATIGRSFF